MHTVISDPVIDKRLAIRLIFNFNIFLKILIYLYLLINNISNINVMYIS